MLEERYALNCLMGVGVSHYGSLLAPSVRFPHILCSAVLSTHSEHVNVVQVRPPKPPVFFFLVDVSMTAVSTGAVAAACSAINRALADLKVSSFTSLCVSSSLCHVLGGKFLRFFVNFVVSVELKRSIVYCTFFFSSLWSLACSCVVILHRKILRRWLGLQHLTLPYIFTT